MENVTVSADALRQVLQALNGPGHYIRELQVLRDGPFGSDNPINKLVEEYNAAVEKHNQQQQQRSCEHDWDMETEACKKCGADGFTT